MTGIEARSSSMPTGAKRGCIDQGCSVSHGEQLEHWPSTPLHYENGNSKR